MTNTTLKNTLRHALLAVAVCALPALAGPDNVGLGTGRDGALTVNSANLVVNTYAQVTAPAATGDYDITVGSIAGFASGDLVMVLQTTGIVPEPPSGGSSPIDLTNDPVGRWEFARLGSVGGTTLGLTRPLLYSYAANVTQVIRVPEYTTVTINGARSISAQPWDGSTGGVAAFLVSGTFANFGSVNVSGRGFRGGMTAADVSGSLGCTGLDEPAAMGAQKGEGIAVTRYGLTHTGRGRVANGAGGGVCFKSGGGGGGNGGSGGNGGNSDLGADSNRAVGGEGGAALVFSAVDHLALGGGGGAGHMVEGNTTTGGSGGGIIFIRANAMSGPGNFFANGNSAGNSGFDAAGGGGAGGTVYLRIAGMATCGTIQALGGVGGNPSLEVGPGGGGAGGRVLFQKGGGTCVPPSTAVIGVNPGTQPNPGAPGGGPYGATPGSNGVATTLPGGFPVLPAPVVETPEHFSVTSDTTPTFSGTVPVPLPAGTEIVIYVDATEIGRVVADASGNWTFTPVVELSPGFHDVYAVAVNTTQGVESPQSNNNSFEIDTLAPQTPILISPADGAVITDPTPTITGVAEPNSTVTVYVDGNPVGTTTADPVGNFSIELATPLPDGVHQAYVTATDGVGNVSDPSNTNTFTVDATPPPPPVVLTPAEGTVTSDATPTYTGTAEPNSTVTVIVDGTPVGTTTADAGGNWTFDQPTDLPEGAHTVSATATDAVGNVSDPSNTNTFTVDTTPPSAPVVLTPAEGTVTSDATPTYTGTAEPNSTVTIIVDGNPVGTTTADAGGNWTFDQPTDLPEGSHTVSATATDDAGNVSQPSNTNTFTVDTTAPAAPVVLTPADGSVTSDATPTYSGTAEPGSTVTIIVDGTPVGTTTADAGGNWTFDQPTDLPEGSHTVSATATDDAGNTSLPSNTNTFTVDTTAPAAPVVLTPADGSVTSDATPTYSGTAEPGSTVTIIVDGTPVGTTTADAGGNWTFDQPTDLPEGSHTVSATATDDAGNTSLPSNTNTFTVDTTAPAAPVVLTPADGSVTSDTTPTYTGTAEPNSTVTVIVDGTPVGTATADGDGNWTFTPVVPLAEGPHSVNATATDAAGNTSPNSNTNDFIVDTMAPAAPVVLTPADGSVTSDATPTYTGTAEPGSTVTIIVDGTPVGTTTADAGGNWTFDQPTGLADGDHMVSATATDAAGNTSPSSNTNTFTVDTTPPGAPVVTTPADGSVTNDPTPTYSGTAEPGSTVTVIIDGTPVGTTTADANGDWSFPQPADLPEGPHMVSATATDEAGNTSPSSTANTFTVDTTAPEAPVVVTPADGSTISDNTPEYTGTAEPGSTVTVIVDGTPVGTTTADANGDWTFTPTEGLAAGSHTVMATATDEAGNISPDSNTNTFIIDATVPEAPVVTGPADGTVTSDTTPTFTGTAEPGSTVTVIVDGTPVGTTTADAAGNWTFTPTDPLAEGPHGMTATATNAAGNVSPASNTVNFTIDTTPPDTTIDSGPSGDTDSSDATFNFSSNEDDVTYECSLDGGAFTPCTDPVTFTNLAEGTHTLEVRARDSAGNVDPTPATATWTVRRAVPGNRAFLGDGLVGCASTGGDPSSLAMMGLALLSALLARARRR